MFYTYIKCFSGLEKCIHLSPLVKWYIELHFTSFIIPQKWNFFGTNWKKIISSTVLSIFSITPQSSILGLIDLSNDYLLIYHLILIYKSYVYNPGNRGFWNLTLSIWKQLLIKLKVVRKKLANMDLKNDPSNSVTVEGGKKRGWQYTFLSYYYCYYYYYYYYYYYHYYLPSFCICFCFYFLFFYLFCTFCFLNEIKVKFSLYFSLYKLW